LKTLAFIKNIISSACVIFTLLFTFIYTLGITVNTDWIPTLGTLYSILAFSLILSAMNKYLFSNSLVLGIRILIHYIVTVLSFYVFFIVASGYAKSGSSALTIMIAFSIIYALFAADEAISNGAKSNDKKKKTQKKTEYKSMFN